MLSLEWEKANRTKELQGAPAARLNFSVLHSKIETQWAISEQSMIFIPPDYELFEGN